MQPLLLKKIRRIILFFMIMLALSGITAFPVYTELTLLKQHGLMDGTGFIATWLTQVYTGVADIQQRYPFLFYGYDWLAFAHLIIAGLFYGVYKHPVRNKFIVYWGMFSCMAIIPLAFICGPIRGIPLNHILIDCCFGILGIIPLIICNKYIGQLEKLKG